MDVKAYQNCELIVGMRVWFARNESSGYILPGCTKEGPVLMEKMAHVIYDPIAGITTDACNDFLGVHMASVVDCLVHCVRCVTEPDAIGTVLNVPGLISAEEIAEHYLPPWGGRQMRHGCTGDVIELIFDARQQPSSEAAVRSDFYKWIGDSQDAETCGSYPQRPGHVPGTRLLTRKLSFMRQGFSEYPVGSENLHSLIETSGLVCLPNAAEVCDRFVSTLRPSDEVPSASDVPLVHFYEEVLNG